MLQWLKDLFAPHPIEDVRIELPAAEIVFNHRLRLAFMFCHDPATRDDSYADMEAHLKRRGYTLTIFVPSASYAHPTREE